MAAKKKTGDLSLVLSRNQFDKFELINDDNIKDYWSFDTLFIMVDVKKNKFTMIHSFFIPQKLSKCKMFYRYWWDDVLVSSSIQIKEEESDQDYSDRLSDAKALIKNSIKKQSLYGSKQFN